MVRGASTVLVLAGALILADVAATLLWQEPISAILGRLNQHRLEQRLERIPAPGGDPLGRRALASLGDDRRRVAFLARRFKRTLRRGQPAGRILIPRIRARYVLVYGTDHRSLTKGPGLYPSQPLPGAPGTAAIAGHRTTYLAPFRHIDRLRRNDLIRIQMPYATLEYRVYRKRSVLPTALSVLRRRSFDQLILSACDPPFSASHRLIVFARLARVTLRRDLAD